MGLLIFQIGLFGVYTSSKALNFDAVDTYLEAEHSTGRYRQIPESEWGSFQKKYAPTWIFVQMALKKAQELSTKDVFKLSVSSPFLPEELRTVFTDKVWNDYKKIFDQTIINSCAQALLDHHGDAKNEEDIIGLASFFVRHAHPCSLPSGEIVFIPGFLDAESLFSEEKLATYILLKDKPGYFEAWVMASDEDGRRKAIYRLARLDLPISSENVECATRLERLRIDVSQENIRGFEIFGERVQAHVKLLDDSFIGVSKEENVGIYYKEWASLPAEEKDKESALFLVMCHNFNTSPGNIKGILENLGITVFQETIRASETFSKKVEAHVKLLDDFFKGVSRINLMPAFYKKWTSLQTEAKDKESALLHLMFLDLQPSPENIKAVMELREKGIEYRRIKQSKLKPVSVSKG